MREVQLQFILIAILQAFSITMMSNIETDSFEEHKTTFLLTRSQLLTPRNQSQVDSVGQFLLSQQKSHIFESTSCKSIENDAVSRGNPPSSSYQEGSNFENSANSRPSKSVFHNFQKHLVTTLKMNILINKTNTKNDPTIHLAQRMWRLFQKTNYFSKRILHFLFGVEGGSKAAAYEGFNQVASIYPQYEIELAQQYLRDEVLRQGKRLLSRSLLSHRRMQRGEEFQSYFEKFLEEIESGAISRRLPKAAKLQLLDTFSK